MRVLIFGTSGLYNRIRTQLSINEVQIVAFVDNDIRKHGTTIDGKKVISPNEISEYEYDYIIIASSFWMQIEQQLFRLGIEKEKIIIPLLLGKSNAEDDENIERKIEKLKENKDRKKISIIVEDGNDRFISRFFDCWIKHFEIYSFNLDSSTSRKYLKEIMLHSDICFFEWGGEVLAYGSNLDEAKNIPIVCRIHRYEVFGNMLDKVNWDNVDKVVFIAEHIRQLFLNKVNINDEKTTLIYNGFNFNRFSFKKREPGFKIAYLGAMIYRKAPEMILQVLEKLVKLDNRYQLFCAGEFETEELKVYFEHIVNEMGLQNNVIYDGYQEDIDKWLEDKNYIICSSVGEGHITAVQEAMIKGIKPIIHNYPGAKEIYGEGLLWNTIDEAVSLIRSGVYDSQRYYDIIQNGFELNSNANKFNDVFKNLLNEYYTDYDK